MTPQGPVSRPRRTRTLILIAGLVAAFIVIIVVAQLTMNSSNSATPVSPTPPASETPPPTQDASEPSEHPSAGTGEHPMDSPLVRRDPDDPMAMGDVDAPVVLIEWTDLRCPFCASFSQDTFPTIVEEYVDAGLVRFEVVDVAFFGDQSVDGQIAARAAGKQDRFFEFLDVAYAAAPDRGHPDLPREKLIGFAEEAGVPDIDQFTADLDDPEVRTAAEQSTEYAQQVGVNAVPFFLAGDVALSGAQPVDVFRDYLDQAVSKVG
ncbi:MAG TPA: DsbA family protein [Candidatus Agrococcus pullicola]|uniref:DsbA family protein n=1 Tax=Candidatus Agrococcus pullicola TaxID=2838429 RepID=A0A9D1Z032_9MICO|nr:DsbA family protein [Candidatus Agrococcus pullicola]